MPVTADSLHDEIDRTEELREKAEQAVRRIVEENIEQAAQSPTILEAFEKLAVLVENELAGQTTEAFKVGVEIGKKRYGKG